MKMLRENKYFFHYFLQFC